MANFNKNYTLAEIADLMKPHYKNSDSFKTALYRNRKLIRVAKKANDNEKLKELENNILSQIWNLIIKIAKSRLFNKDQINQI